MNQNISYSPAGVDRAFLYVKIYVLPFVYVLGLIGNCMSVVVCLNYRLRRVPSSLHLSALAIYDSLALLSYALIWLQAAFGWPTIDTAVGCPLLSYITNVSGCLSAWSVTAFTIERFIVVFYPLHRAAMCTTRKTKKLLLFLLPYPILVNIPYFIITTIETSGSCDVKPSSRTINSVLGFLDTVTTCLVPIVVIFTLNALIAHRIVHQETSDLRRHTGGDGSSRDPSVTLMLMTVSTVFAVLNLPSYALRCKVQLTMALGRRDWWTRFDATMEHVGVLLYHCNFAIDFALYNLSSKNFRKIALEVICKRARDRGTSSMRPSSSRPQTLVTSTGV